MCEREERSGTSVCRGQPEAQAYQVHAQRINSHQEALEACRIQSRSVSFLVATLNGMIAKAGKFQMSQS